VTEYLEDYHTPLTPGTYQGKRLPQWLIKVMHFSAQSSGVQGKFWIESKA
jgi:hypothetical protein